MQSERIRHAQCNLFRFYQPTPRFLPARHRQAGSCGDNRLGPSVTYLTSGTVSYAFSGTGLTHALVDGVRVITGGVITQISTNFEISPAMVLSGLTLATSALQQAITADLAGTDDAAVENLFRSLGWAYSGKATRDVLLETSRSSDGAQLNLAGDESISNGGGADDFWLGSGNDPGSGGGGDDRLDGGRGQDTLAGDNGNDTLLGGTAGDALDGGTGEDSLEGGSGAEVLSGGKGLDTLTGGAGRDTFLFALRDGQDQIMDLDLAQDRIDLMPGAAHSFAAADAGVILHCGRFGDQVLLTGVNIADFGAISIA